MELMYIIATADLQKLHSSKMHLVLPHLYKNKEYLETYKGWGLAGEFIMQDNSIFELGASVSGRELMDFAKQLPVSELVLPEVLRDSGGCLEKIDEFFSWLPHKPEGMRFAACLQGRAWDEIADQYDILNSDFPQIDTICIPFGLEFDCLDNHDEDKLHSGWNRFSNIFRLIKEKVWDSNKTHHLFGLNNPAELAMYAQFPVTKEVLHSIRSNDSSICYRYGQYGAHFTMKEGLLYKKIKGPLDFNSYYTSPEQEREFLWNCNAVEAFARGKGGVILKRRYVEYARASADLFAELLGNSI